MGFFASTMACTDLDDGVIVDPSVAIRVHIHNPVAR
jgi:hypothetical protein